MDNVSQLKLNGYTVLKDVFSDSECETFIHSLSKIVKINSKELPFTIGKNSTFTPNFMRHNSELMQLINIKPVDDILNQVIDEDYVLIACNAINRVSSEDNESSLAVGQDWHTDSRYVGGKRMEPGIFFSVLVMLDSFSEENGATSYVPNSHLRTDRPFRDGSYDSFLLEGNVGDVVIFDSGIWHKGGISTTARRWGVFNLYGPWFIKPYFNFPVMMQDKVENLTTKDKKLLHFNCTPPNDETERFTTLVKAT